MPDAEGSQSDVPMNLVDGFYIVRPLRRKGVGARAAHLTFDRYATPTVSTTWPDDARVAFWHTVFKGYAGGTTEEHAAGQHKGFPGQWVWIAYPGQTGAEPEDGGD